MLRPGSAVACAAVRVGEPAQEQAVGDTLTLETQRRLPRLPAHGHDTTFQLRSMDLGDLLLREDLAPYPIDSDLAGDARLVG